MIRLFLWSLILSSFKSFWFKSDTDNLSKQNTEGPNYELVWQDEFNEGTRPDNNNWSYENGFVRNQELQWYQPDNAIISDGMLVIEGRREHVVNRNYDVASDSWKKRRPHASYTSASINTRGKHSFQYGIFEVRARIDTSLGMWPAIWTLGIDKRWPANGEVDIMEFYRIDGVSTILANAAWAGVNRESVWDNGKYDLDHFYTKTPKWADEFHVWKMEWTPDFIKLYLDDELLNDVDLSKTINPDGFNPFHQPHYLLLNLAIGSNGDDPSSTTFPRIYEVDYVRVYQVTD